MGIGRWQAIVWLWEIDPEADPEDKDAGLLHTEYIFTSEEERDRVLKERIATGLVFDIMAVVESTWTELEEGDVPFPSMVENEGDRNVQDKRRPSSETLEGIDEGAE